MRTFERCPRCQSKLKPAIALSGGESEFWLECIRCNTFVNTYIPQDHQEKVHRDPHRFIGNFGGYGSGKTLTSREEFYKHMFITTGGNTLIGANVQSQYEQTIKRDIEADLPVAFVSHASSQKQFIDFRNGHRLMFRPFDDPNKLRSYNLTMFIMVEASEIKADAYSQLKTRLRNTAATLARKDENGKTITRIAKNGVEIPIIEFDWRKGIIESNPDAGWIRSDVLLKSHLIERHGRVADTYAVLESERDIAIASHVTATSANEFLPPSFIENVCANRPSWWINRYINSSFQYAEGLVYPSIMSHVVSADLFKGGIPRHWKRIVAFDYGLSDDAVFLFGAVDEMNGIIYIYKEIRVNDRSVEQLAQHFFDGARDIPMGGWVCQPIIDPKSGPKRDYDKKSLSDHFLEYGISFQPGHVNLDARIYRLNTYLESGKLKILDTCEGLIREGRDYKFKTRAMDSTSWDNKPEDKNNHAVNCLEWIVMEMPTDPRQIIHGIFNRRGEDLTRRQFTEVKQYASFALDLYENETSYQDTGEGFGITDYNF